MKRRHAWLLALLVSTPLVGEVVRVPLADRPRCMTLGPDGNLWLTTEQSGLIYRVTPSGTGRAFPARSSTLQDIAVGPDAALWYNAGQSIGRITVNGATTLFPVGDPSSTHSLGIVPGADGAIWFGRLSSNAISIGRMDVLGNFTILSQVAGVFHLARGGDGNVWFTSGNAIWKITPAGAISFVMPSGPALTAFGSAPDGSIWFKDSGSGADTGKLVHIAINGAVTDYPLPSAAGEVEAIAFAPDGSTWFAGTGALGRITPSGMSLYRLASQLTPPQVWRRPVLAITADGRLWIGQYQSDPTPPPPPSASAKSPTADAPKNSYEVVGISPDELGALAAPASVPVSGTLGTAMIAVVLILVGLWRMRAA